MEIIIRGGSEDCAANVPEWSSIGNFQVRREQRNGYHTCSIHGRIGADVAKPEEVMVLDRYVLISLNSM